MTKHTTKHHHTSSSPEVEAPPQPAAPQTPAAQVPEADAQPTEQPTVVPTTTPQAVSHHHAKVILIVLGVIVIAAGFVAGGFFIYNQLANKQAREPEVQQENKSESQTYSDPILQKMVNPTTGEKWLATPKKLDDQHYYQEIYAQDGVDYYEVGSHGDKTIIMSVVQMIGDDIRLYEKSPNGDVAVIAKPDSLYIYDTNYMQSISGSLVESIAIDETTHYDSLTLPRTLDLDKGYTLSKPTYPNLGDLVRADISGYTVTTVRKLGGSNLLRLETTNAETKLTSIGYSLQTPINTRINLGYEPLETDLSKYQWQNGNYTNDTITAISQGCGGLFASVSWATDLKDGDFKEAGESPSGQKVYAASNLDNPVFVKAYDEYMSYLIDNPEDLYYTSNKDMTKQDFADQHGVVFHKDRFGQWLAYSRSQMRPAYGCAKPVVYLYPKGLQYTTVKVGAKVTESDPLYNSNKGWQVLATPSGKLLLGGRLYDSLFWEGQGSGVYPSITSGTVVKTSDAPQVIRDQLHQQGLNTKEISDFMDYWQPKLPTQPYTRLTWFNTAQMDELAPLSISPKPDTTIRVFLDASGLAQPIELPPQHFSAPQRQGFTVVEWGGLAR